MRAGDPSAIRDGDGHVLLSYRSFASIVGIVGALVAGIVLIAGAAATVFLLAEERRAAAAAAVILSLAFAAGIVALIPRTRVTLYDGSKPALTIVQHSRVPFPFTTYTVQDADGVALGLLRRSALSRLARNKWSISSPPDQQGVGYAIEESLSRALRRKVLGKFRRKYESNLHIIHQGMPAGEIVRRPDGRGEFDLLQLPADSTLDRRVAVALATLVFGSEP